MKKSLLGIVVLMVLILSSCTTAPKGGDSDLRLVGQWLCEYYSDGQVVATVLWDFKTNTRIEVSRTFHGKTLKKDRSEYRIEGNKIIFSNRNVALGPLFFDLSTADVLKVKGSEESDWIPYKRINSAQ